MRRLFIAPVALALTLAGLSNARADVLYNNLGPGDTFSDTFFYRLSGPSASSAGMKDAYLYTPTQTTILDQIEIGIQWTGGNNRFSFTIAPDAAGLPSNTPLWSVDLDNVIPDADPSLVSLSVTGGVTLNAGKTYWLIGSAREDAVFVWSQNTTGDNSGRQFFSNDNGFWTNFPTDPAPSLRLSGSLVAVPEPGTFGLLAISLPVIAFALRRHKRR